MSYECKRCFHKFKQKPDIVRHLNRTKICIRTPESYQYDESELIELSLINMNSKNKNNKYSCINCNKCYTRDNYLKIHLTKCKGLKNNLLKIDENNNEIKNINNSYVINTNNNINNNTNNNTNNITNNITNNNNININFNLNFEPPVPFDEDWNLTDIDSSKKTELILSQLMYTQLLKEILNNDKNLNIIYEQNTDTGIVYKNDNEKYVNMNFNDIIENTMNKLKNYLLNFVNDSINNNGLKQILEQIPEIIQNKHNNFINKDDVKNHVKHYMGIIFTSKKEDSIKILNNLKNIENKPVNENIINTNVSDNIENLVENEDIFM